MAEQKTSWILELVDQITKPIRGAMKSVSSATSMMDEMTEAVKLNERDTRKALENEQKHYKDLQRQIKDVEAEIKGLEKVKKDGDWLEAQQAAKDLKNAEQKAERLRTALQGCEQDIRALSDRSDDFSRSAQNWTDITTGINQGVELIQKATDGLDFTVDVQRLTNDVQRMTELTGGALDEFVRKSRNISSVYQEEALDIARAANAMTKQNGGTYQENLKLIEEGYKRGANLNGDFLDQLKEYQPFIRQLGLSQSEAIALIAQSGKNGIYSDKAIDSIKEADLSLREMNKAQVDALAGIGLKPSDLVGKTTFESVKLISEKMKGATTQARQLILADIFKGAGEDAGMMWTESLSQMDLDLSKVPAIEQSGTWIRSFFSDISTWAGQAFGSVGIYAQQLSPMIQAVAGAIPIWQMLSKVSMVQTAATWALNAAQTVQNALFIASPIGWIILAITALVGIVTYCWNKFEGFRLAVFQGWEALKLFGTVIKDFVIDRLKGLLSGITGIGKALVAFFSGEWSEAWKIGKQAASELVGIDAGQKAAENFKSGWKGAMGKGLAAHQQNEKERESEKQAKGAVPSINDYLSKPTDALDGKVIDTNKNGKTAGDGLNVGSGSNGLKSITMTLNVTNNFSVSKNTNLRDVADKITGMMNDQMRDAIINVG